MVCRFLAGDVRDATRLRYAIADVNILVHATAMKHVDVIEVTSAEAVTINVFGTQHVIEMAIDAGVERVMLTSSDMAVYTAKKSRRSYCSLRSLYSGSRDWVEWDDDWRFADCVS